jgi:hypothetical protein
MPLCMCGFLIISKIIGLVILYLFNIIIMTFFLKKDKLARAECVRCPWALLRNKVSTINGVFFSFSQLSTNITFLPEGVIVGFWNFAWGFNSQKKDLGWNKFIFGKNKKYLRLPEMARKWFPPPPLFRHLSWKISSSVDGLSGGSSVRRPMSEGPHRR